MLTNILQNTGVRIVYCGNDAANVSESTVIETAFKMKYIGTFT